MEIKSMGGLRTRARLNIVKNLRAVFGRVGAFRPNDFQNCLPSEMFSYCVPYEASKTYRIMKTEFERERCAAVMEAHRQGLRGY